MCLFRAFSSFIQHAGPSLRSMYTPPPYLTCNAVITKLREEWYLRKGTAARTLRWCGVLLREVTGYCSEEAGAHYALPPKRSVVWCEYKHLIVNHRSHFEKSVLFLHRALFFHMGPEPTFSLHLFQPSYVDAVYIHVDYHPVEGVAHDC